MAKNLKNLLGAQSVEAVTHNDKYDNNISFERNGERLKSVNKQIGKQLLKEIYPGYDNNEALKENISNFHKEVSRDINPDNNDKHNMSYHNVHDYSEEFVLRKKYEFGESDESKKTHISHVSHHQLNQNGNVTTAFIRAPIVKIKSSSGFKNLELTKNILGENKVNIIKELLENSTSNSEHWMLIKKTYSLDADIATKKTNVSQDISNDCVELGKKYGLGNIIPSNDRPDASEILREIDALSSGEHSADEGLNSNCIMAGADPGDNKLFRRSNPTRRIWHSKSEPEVETTASIIFKYGNPMFENMVLRSRNVKVGHKEGVEFEKLNYNDLRYIEIKSLVPLHEGRPTSEWHKFFNETANSNSYFFLKAGKISINPNFQQKNDGSDATNDDDKTAILDIKCENLNLFMSISNEEYANNNNASKGASNTFINISIPEIFICCHTNADIDHIMNDASYVVTKAILDSIDLQLLPHF